NDVAKPLEAVVGQGRRPRAAASRRRRGGGGRARGRGLGSARLGDGRRVEQEAAALRLIVAGPLGRLGPGRGRGPLARGRPPRPRGNSSPKTSAGGRAGAGASRFAAEPSRPLVSRMVGSRAGAASRGGADAGCGMRGGTGFSSRFNKSSGRVTVTGLMRGISK